MTPIQFPAVEPGEDLKISATTFVSFEECPDRAAARFRGIYPPESRPSFVGKLAHRIFARHLKTGPIEEGGLEAACRQEIGEGLNMSMGELGLKPSQLSGVIKEVGDLYARFKSLGVDGFEGAEVDLDVEPADGVKLVGRIDAVFDDEAGGSRLVDWKTGGVGDPSPQLSFYAMLWAFDKGALPQSVEAVSVATGERIKESPSLDGVQKTADRVSAMVSTLRATWRDRGEFDRVAGPWCRWCPLLDECADGQSATALLDKG